MNFSWQQRLVDEDINSTCRGIKNTDELNNEMNKIICWYMILGDIFGLQLALKRFSPTFSVYGYHYPIYNQVKNISVETVSNSCPFSPDERNTSEYRYMREALLKRLTFSGDAPKNDMNQLNPENIHRWANRKIGRHIEDQISIIDELNELLMSSSIDTNNQRKHMFGEFI
jgi:hypothetical protein